MVVLRNREPCRGPGFTKTLIFKITKFSTTSPSTKFSIDTVVDTAVEFDSIPSTVIHVHQDSCCTAVVLYSSTTAVHFGGPDYSSTMAIIPYCT
jgi:hypothetical protein